MKKKRPRRAVHATRRAAARPEKKKDAPEPATQAVLLSISQWADASGHDRSTVAKRITELEIRPAEERRGYPVYKLSELLEMERRAPDGKQDPDKMSPFERQAHFKAESERLRVDAERGELMRRDDAEREWARVLKAIAQELDTVVDEFERDLGATPAMLEKMEQKLDVIRERMYASATAPAPEEPVQTSAPIEADAPVR